MARKWRKKRSGKEEPYAKETGLHDTSDEELASQSTAAATSFRWLCFGRRRVRHTRPRDMKKFGFGKKSEGDDDDRKRVGIFGRKKPAPQDENPYAQQPAEDPYARMTPYQQARAGLAAGQQAARPGAAGLPSGPRPGGNGLPSSPAQRNGYGTPPASYQGSLQVGGGYAPDKFGATGGYGANRYDAGTSGYGGGAPPASQTSARLPSRGPGGYGGLGPAEEEANRDELLAGARHQHSAPPSYMSTDNNDVLAPSAVNASHGAGGYGEQRELTAEEQEEEEYQSIVNQGKQMKREDLATIRQTTQRAREAVATARGTTARMAEQEERLRNAEKNLDVANASQKLADEKTRELNTLNRSMFAVHVANPFTKGKREAQLDNAMLERHREERDIASATRKDAFQAAQQNERDFNEAAARLRPRAPAADSETKTADRARYRFVDNDPEDEELEDGIEEGLDELGEVVGDLRIWAGVQAKMTDRSNDLIDRVADKAKGVDEGLSVTRAKLSRIH